MPRASHLEAGFPVHWRDLGPRVWSFDVVGVRVAPSCGSWILTKPPEATARNKKDEALHRRDQVQLESCVHVKMQGGIQTAMLHTCPLIA